MFLKLSKGSAGMLDARFYFYLPKETKLTGTGYFPLAFKPPAQFLCNMIEEDAQFLVI